MDSVLPDPLFVLSHYQARPLLDAHTRSEPLPMASLDLGRTATDVREVTDGIELPDGSPLTWEQLGRIAADENGCYRARQGVIRRIQEFSAAFNRHYSLYPTTGAPTLLISGIPMHRIQKTDPMRDTGEKTKALGRVAGDVLDTATGLGYTAVALARYAARVITVELDPTVLSIGRESPWSQELFRSPRIEQLVGDSADLVAEMAADSFDAILHDPPMFSLAGQLYGGDFYQELHRILRPRGRLFHYIGNPASPSGRSMTRSVTQRLQAAGFDRIQRRPRAFGLVARKT